MKNIFGKALLVLPLGLSACEFPIQTKETESASSINLAPEAEASKDSQKNRVVADGDSVLFSLEGDVLGSVVSSEDVTEIAAPNGFNYLYWTSSGEPVATLGFPVYFDGLNCSGNMYILHAKVGRAYFINGSFYGGSEKVSQGSLLLRSKIKGDGCLNDIDANWVDERDDVEAKIMPATEVNSYLDQVKMVAPLTPSQK